MRKEAFPAVLRCPKLNTFGSAVCKACIAIRPVALTRGRGFMAVGVAEREKCERRETRLVA